VKFIVDAQLPKKIALMLVEKGFDAMHTLDLPQKNLTSDKEIALLADREDRILITKDNDFKISYHLQKPPRKLILITTGNIKNDDLLHIIKSNIKLIITHFENSCFVEINSYQIIIHQ
jgi:predicted nuclease of predicted toxin-antitoxin system